MVCVGSLTSWPLPFVPVSRPRFALAPCSSFPLSWFPFGDSVQPRSFAPGCSAPCPSLGFTLAPSRHSLLTFCLPLRYLASGAPLDLAVCLSRLRSFDCPGVSLHLEVALPRCDPSGAPSLGFLPSTFLQIQARFRSWLIFVHLKAYELSPVQLLPLLRPTHGFTHCCALKFKVFRIAIRFSKILAPLARRVNIPQTKF